MTELERLWVLLNDYTRQAMEWPTVEVAGVWDDAAHYRITWLENELEKARATSVGRGLAIAIQLLDPEAYGDSTAVVMESLRRYEEGKKE